MSATLYILMRDDLNSLNPGKACAQASHASNQMVATLPNDDYYQKLYAEWTSECGSFGTTIVLSGNINTINKTIEVMKNMNFHASLVHDPTYPIADGKTTHFIPLDTCGFIFMDKQFSEIYLKHYDLMA